MTEIESKHGIVSRQPYELYMSFVDMRNFLQMLPEDKKKDVQADYDTITATVQGFNIGVKVHERVPYSRIELVDYGAPFAFHIELHFDPAPANPYQTEFWVKLEADLNLMMKMMLGGKIKAGLDKVVDGLVQRQDARRLRPFPVQVLMLPEAFIRNLSEELGRDRARTVLDALSGEPSVSVRLNPAKLTACPFPDAERVPWSPYGYLLKERPNFTLDPLFHAGCYYVQDSSAMFVGALFRRALDGFGPGVTVLDLCAAPGCQTTDLAASLRERFGDRFSLLANEVMRNRFGVLRSRMSAPGAIPAWASSPATRRLFRGNPSSTSSSPTSLAPARACSARTRRPWRTGLRSRWTVVRPVPGASFRTSGRR